MEPKSSGNEVGQLAEAMTTTNAIIPLMHPCLGEILDRLCAVVAKVRVGYLSIKAYYFWGANEEKKSCQGQERVLTCTPLSIKWRLGGIGYGPGYVLLGYTTSRPTPLHRVAFQLGDTQLNTLTTHRFSYQR